MKFSMVLFLVSILAVVFATPYVLPKISPKFKQISSTENSKSTNNSVTYYKWQDANGNWQFSDKSPEGLDITKVKVNTNTNILQSFKEKVSNKLETSQTTSEKDKEANIPTSPIILPSQAKELIEDAKNIEQLMEDRQNKITQQINSL